MWRLIPCTDCGIEVQMPLSTYRLTTQCNSCAEHSRLSAAEADKRMTRTVVTTVGVVLVLAVILALR
jgi:hypothetical protein